jgi:hypothetical protein
MGDAMEEGLRGILEVDTLVSTARGPQATVIAERSNPSRSADQP